MFKGLKMTESVREKQIKEFNELKMFDSKSFDVSTETSRDSMVQITKLPCGYVVNLFFGGSSHTAVFPNKE